MISVVKEYLDKFIDNKLNEYDYLSENVEINFSTVGQKQGKGNVLAALKLDEEFGYRYNVVSNVIEYKQDDYDVVILNAFHFLVKESSSYNVQSATSYIKGQIFPLIFGGHYKFYIKNNLIEKIYFDLAAQFGNTYWLKSLFNYRPYEESAKDTPRVLLDKDAQTKDCCDKCAITNLISKLMIIADSKQVELVNEYAKEDSIYKFIISTYAGRMGELDPNDLSKHITIKDFVSGEYDKEQQNHHSCKITDIKIDGNKAAVTLTMFEPTRLGFKHFYLNTIYQIYYNEMYKIELEKVGNNWKVSSLERKPISKFEQLGYKTIEIQEADLWS